MSTTATDRLGTNCLEEVMSIPPPIDATDAYASAGIVNAIDTLAEGC